MGTYMSSELQFFPHGIVQVTWLVFGFCFSGWSSLSPYHVLLTGRIHSALCPLTTEGTLGIRSTSTNMCSAFLLQYSICWLGLQCLPESSVSLPSTGMLNIRPRVIFSSQCYTWVGGFQIHYLFFSVLVSSSSQSASTSLVPKCLLAEPPLWLPEFLINDSCLEMHPFCGGLTSLMG